MKGSVEKVPMRGPSLSTSQPAGRVGKGAMIVLLDLVDGHPETFKVAESKC